MTIPVLLVALAVFAGLEAARAWRARKKLLAKIRANWGQLREHPRDRDMDAIADYHRSRAEAGDSSQFLDDRTWNDLLLDDVFAVLDRAESTLGQQLLYHRLRMAPAANHLEAFEALTDRMTRDAVARERAQLSLTRLQNPAGYNLWWLVQPDALDTQRRHLVFPLLAGGMFTVLLLAVKWPGLLILVAAWVVAHMGVRFATAPRIRTVVGAFRQVAPLIITAEDLAFLEGSDTDPLTGPLHRELPHLQRLKRMARWVSRDPLTLDQLTAFILEFLNLLFLLDENVLYFAARELRRCGPALLQVIAAVGEVDAAVSVASFRAGTPDWVRPRFPAPGTCMTLTNIRHPLVRDAVPNSIVLGPPHGALVTGSNMSGKTTFVRTIGVSAVMAQTINTCLATVYEAPIVYVRSCIGRADDLIAGKSYYLVEVEAVLALVRASGNGSPPHLFLFDELFRGTNAVERIAAAEAVLRELIGDGDHLKAHVVVAATHDGELVDLLGDRYTNYHFQETLGSGGLEFDHRLQPGPARTRNAIALLQHHGAPARMISRALARAAALDRERAVVTSRAGGSGS